MRESGIGLLRELGLYRAAGMLAREAVRSAGDPGAVRYMSRPPEVSEGAEEAAEDIEEAECLEPVRSAPTPRGRR